VQVGVCETLGVELFLSKQKVRLEHGEFVLLLCFCAFVTWCEFWREK
jgi:hypothetical protein